MLLIDFSGLSVGIILTLHLANIPSYERNRPIYVNGIPLQTCETAVQLYPVTKGLIFTANLDAKDETRQDNLMKKTKQSHINSSISNDGFILHKCLINDHYEYDRWFALLFTISKTKSYLGILRKNAIKGKCCHYFNLIH